MSLQYYLPYGLALEDIVFGKGTGKAKIPPAAIQFSLYWVNEVDRHRFGGTDPCLILALRGCALRQA